jgi:hypothetical protein
LEIIASRINTFATINYHRPPIFIEPVRVSASGFGGNPSEASVIRVYIDLVNNNRE